MEPIEGGCTTKIAGHGISLPGRRGEPLIEVDSIVKGKHKIVQTVTVPGVILFVLSFGKSLRQAGPGPTAGMLRWQWEGNPLGAATVYHLHLKSRGLFVIRAVVVWLTAVGTGHAMGAGDLQLLEDQRGGPSVE